MKKITIVGIGTNYNTVTIEGINAIERSDVLIGGGLTLGWFEKTVEKLNIKTYAEWRADETKTIIDNEIAENIVVLVSGDVGFYSGAELLAKSLKNSLTAYDVTLIPGISTVQKFFAKVKLPWKNAALMSMHIRNQNIVDTIRRNEFTFALTAQNKALIGEKLTKFGFGKIKVYVGENLDSESERIFETTAEKIGKMTIKENRTVLIFENPNFDNRMRFGINDDEFIQGDVPMTKAEIRAIVMGKMAISPDDICVDIGAGTGSVTIEIALSAYKGKVFAIEKNHNACELIEQNSVKFQVGNIEISEGEATEILPNLPACDVAFIGGNGGKLKEITEILITKNPKIKIVLTAITLKTLQTALEIFPNCDCVQINSSRLKNGLLTANNPVFVISNQV